MDHVVRYNRRQRQPNIFWRLVKRRYHRQSGINQSSDALRLVTVSQELE